MTLDDSVLCAANGIKHENPKSRIPRTESEKVRESINLSDAEIISLAHRQHIKFDVDSAGAPGMSYESWKFLSDVVKQ
jgi:hypothetical protein